MKINIVERLHPFTHVPGTVSLLPFTSLSVLIFPTLLRFHDLANDAFLEVKLFLKGPIQDFTVMADLEKGRVTVFGHTQDGFVMYHLLIQEEQVVLKIEKAPKSGVRYFMNNEEGMIKGVLFLPLRPLKKEASSSERLSLGMHKSQDWQLVHRRGDLKEIFPHWLRLAHLTPNVESKKEKKGMFALVQECESLIHSKETTKLVSQFTALFLAGFKGILVPRLFDEEYQGIVEQEVCSSSPLTLLRESANLIRALFFTEDRESIALLPCLPPEFHAGRFTGIQCENGNIIDMEWSKKLLRRAVIHSHSESEISLDLQKSIKSFRIRRSLKERGLRQKASDPISLQKGTKLYIDCIQK